MLDGFTLEARYKRTCNNVDHKSRLPQHGCIIDGALTPQHCILRADTRKTAWLSADGLLRIQP